MDFTAAPVQSASAATVPDKIRHLPIAAQQAYLDYARTGNPALLESLVFALLEVHLPRKVERPIAGYPADTSLVDGLGFDSISITELVFFTEDLFGITISNEEILRVRTIADLTAFVRGKVAAR